MLRGVIPDIGLGPMSFEERTVSEVLLDGISSKPRIELTRNVIDNLAVAKEEYLWKKYGGQVCKMQPREVKKKKRLAFKK